MRVKKMSEKQEETNEKENVRLSKEEKRYYTTMLEEADEIAHQYEKNMYDDPSDSGAPSAYIVSRVFDKIATPLFYLRDNTGIEKKEDSIGREIAEVMMNAGGENRAEKCNEGHCSAKEEKDVVNEYDEPISINDILGERVKILDIREVEEGGFGGSDLMVENIGAIRTYSKVLGGQIQHLKDTKKLPAVGKIEKKHGGKTGRSYFNFSSSSFMSPRDPKTKPIFAGDQERTLADEEKEICEFMEY